VIHYQLRCGQDHNFDGWFGDSAGFEQQVARGLLACPVCADTQVERALMAPALTRRANRVSEAAAAAQPGPAPSPSPGPKAVTGPRMPDELRAVLQQLRADIERTCDYVGPGFAEEARRIHRGDTSRRNIYGETTPEQAEALTEEGIEFGRVPWVPRADG
jgi:hypothetical protein